VNQRVLRLAPGLTLPVDAVTQAIGILAKRRAGKSYTARRFAEQLFKAGQQLVIVDLSRARLAAVCGLLLRRCPTAVLGRVRTIVIDAINRMADGRSFAHVLEECLEAITPAIAYCNSARAIFGIIASTRIQAAVLESLPSRVFNRVRHAVCAVGFSNALQPETAAGHDSLSQMVLADGHAIPAITATNPCSVPDGRWPSLSKHKQPTESVSSQIRRWAHTHTLMQRGALVGSISQ
jgi:hypothetical protein